MECGFWYLTCTNTTTSSHTHAHTISSSVCIVIFTLHVSYSTNQMEVNKFLLFNFPPSHTCFCARQHLVHLQALKEKPWALMAFCCPGPCHPIPTISKAMSLGNFHLSLSCSYLKEENAAVAVVSSWEHKYRIKQYLSGLRHMMYIWKLAMCKVWFFISLFLQLFLSFFNLVTHFLH